MNGRSLVSSTVGRADQYRLLEARVRARAWNVSPSLRVGWENLAEAYAGLAEQTEGNSDTTVQPFMGRLQPHSSLKGEIRLKALHER